ncbi:MAG: lipoprotein [Bacteroidota bacterium]
MKKISLFAILIILLLAGCSKDEDFVLQDEGNDVEAPIEEIVMPITAMPCNIESINLLGAWQFEKRFYNNIADLSAECCQILELSASDFQNAVICGGAFVIEEIPDPVSGTFSIDIDNNLIQFNFSDRFLVYEFLIEDDVMNFRYKEDGVDIIEVWQRQ